MAATYTSIVKRVRRDLDALPEDASREAVQKACKPLRDLVQCDGSKTDHKEHRRRRDRLFGMIEYHKLAKRHAALIHRAFSRDFKKKR